MGKGKEHGQRGRTQDGMSVEKKRKNSAACPVLIYITATLYPCIRFFRQTTRPNRRRTQANVEVQTYRPRLHRLCPNWSSEMIHKIRPMQVPRQCEPSPAFSLQVNSLVPSGFTCPVRQSALAGRARHMTIARHAGLAASHWCCSRH